MLRRIGNMQCVEHISVARNPRSLCIVDNSLKDRRGHNYEYSRSLYDVARVHGDECVVLGHRQLDPIVAREMGICPAFRYDFYYHFPSIRRGNQLIEPILLNWFFYRDLDVALGKRPDQGWTVFMPSVDQRQLLAWSWWLRRFPPYRSPALILFFRFPYQYADTSPVSSSVRALWWRFGLRALERVADKHNLRFSTDSQRLANEYMQFTNLPIEVLPIPHTQHASAAFEARNRTDGKAQKPLVMGMLGDTRDDKGFPFIARAIPQLLPEIKSGKVEFVLQWLSAPGGSKSDRTGLEQIPGVRLLGNVLSTEVYYGWLARCDVVMVPYSAQVYRARTSGVLVEAFAAGKPVITTEDTWMSDQLAAGAGLTFKDGDVEDFARAVREMIGRFDELRAQMLSRRREWLAFHNADRLYSTLMDGK